MVNATRLATPRSDHLATKSTEKLSLSALTHLNLTMPTACARTATMPRAALSWLPYVITKNVLFTLKVSARTAISAFTTKIRETAKKLILNLTMEAIKLNRSQMQLLFNE